MNMKKFLKRGIFRRNEQVSINEYYTSIQKLQSSLNTYTQSLNAMAKALEKKHTMKEISYTNLNASKNG